MTTDQHEALSGPALAVGQATQDLERGPEEEGAKSSALEDRSGPEKQSAEETMRTLIRGLWDLLEAAREFVSSSEGATYGVELAELCRDAETAAQALGEIVRSRASQAPA